MRHVDDMGPDAVAPEDAGPDVSMPADLLERVTFGPDGLVTAVVQQHDSREVLMVAWMDAAALQETLATRRGTYFSRSRQERWRKGDTSGHVQRVVAVSTDCDGDTLLVEVDQVGPACHTGSRSCFDERPLLGREHGTDTDTDPGAHDPGPADVTAGPAGAGA